MIDTPNPPEHPPSIRALLVPANPETPIHVIDLPPGEESLEVLQQAVGGAVDVQIHDEGDIWLNDKGRHIDLPINVRANHWMLNASAKAREDRVGESMIMYGDAVITGPPDQHGDLTAVNPQIADYFTNLSLAQDAMSDWDVRNTGLIIIIQEPESAQDLGDLGWGL